MDEERIIKIIRDEERPRMKIRRYHIHSYTGTEMKNIEVRKQRRRINCKLIEIKFVI